MFFLALIVFLFSLVQSVLGVGLLLFGTPTLLLLGYPFEKVLLYLLPCSIGINLLQVAADWKQITLKKNFLLFCLPFVGLGLWGILQTGQTLHIKKYVGSLMIATALIRLVPALKQNLQKIFQKSAALSLSAIGLMHGLTNMGGGLLSLFVGSLLEEKEKIRANIAFGYCLMAVCQLAVLIFVQPQAPEWSGMVLPAIAVTTYLTVGHRIFKISSEIQFQRILTAAISAFGMILLLA